MQTKIVDTETGFELGRDESTEIAVIKARRKRPLGNISYVVGAAAITIHDCASIFVSIYRWFACYYENKCPNGYCFENALARRELWRKIMASREMSSENRITLPMSQVIGTELAVDFELLLKMYLDPNYIVSGPDLQERWREIKKKGFELSKTHESMNYVLAYHDEFGTIVVAPASMLTGYDNFFVRSHFNSRVRAE